MVKKRVILVHGWGGDSLSDWIPWLKEELENRNFDVISPDMPNTENPKIEEWVNHLNKVIKNPDYNTYFVGHSIGCQAIMRYIEKLPREVKIGGLLFVAGWFNLQNLETEEEISIAKPWIETLINFNNVYKKVESILVIISDDEPFGFVVENSKMFREKLGAKVFIAKSQGHFNKNKAPLVLNKFLEMSK